MKRLPLATLLGVLALLVLGGNTALAGPPPAYFVDESKLPFDALADVKPAGDDILNPTAVADPKFGCQFSVPGHAGFPACTP